jgi:hypothetical protein
MTKGTTRRERKYRKKAVSVCKITSTSSMTNAGNKSLGNNQEHGLLVTTALAQSASTETGISSGSQVNSNTTNGFSSSQTSVNKVNLTCVKIELYCIVHTSSQGNIGFDTHSHDVSRFYCCTFSSVTFKFAG